MKKSMSNTFSILWKETQERICVARALSSMYGMLGGRADSLDNLKLLNGVLVV